MTNCPNCGAPITKNKCEYCGTIFRFIETEKYKISARKPSSKEEEKTRIKKLIMEVLIAYTGIKVVYRFCGFKKEEKILALSVSEIKSYLPIEVSSQQVFALLRQLELEYNIKRIIDKQKALWYTEYIK